MRPETSPTTIVRRSLAAVLAVLGLVACAIGMASVGAGAAVAGEPAAEATSTTEPTQPTEPTEPTEPTATGDPTGDPDATDGPSVQPSDDPPQDPTDEPSDEPSSPPADTLEHLTSAVLRWGLNNESNTAAYNPGTYNFLVAGRIPDPGKGGQLMPASRWKQKVGNVAVEKWNAAKKAWRPATWKGLRTDSGGKDLRIGTPSEHQLVFSRGTGTLDRAAGTARIAWDGDATVVYYSGVSFFYLSDPVLTIAEGRGTLTATLGGFGSSQADMSLWLPLTETEVTVATLSNVRLVGDGFTVTPDYRGVAVELETGTQKRDAKGWGAFPQGWVSFMEQVGTASFWYTSGGFADPNKEPLPVTVAWHADRAVAPTPAPTATAPAEVENSAPPPPGAGGAPLAVGGPPVGSGALPPVAASAAPGAQPGSLLARPEPHVALQPMSAPVAAPADRAWTWWGGGALLLLAAAALLVPGPLPVRGRP